MVIREGDRYSPVAVGPHEGELDVDVVMPLGHSTDPDLNGPPAEQPVVDRLLVERSAEARDRRRLQLSPGSYYPSAHNPQPSDNSRPNW
jgi:hypothetical protein